MKRWIHMGIFLLACSGLLATPLPALANPLAPYIAAAKKEGTVRIGVSLRARRFGKPAASKYFAAFQKHYPFLKVKFKRIGGHRERERVFTEMVAGMFNYDVATVSPPDIGTLVAAKLPRVVDWQKLGVPKILVDPDNIVLSFRTMVYGIAYNRDHITDQEAQHFTWETCTDPKYKGKTAMDDRPRHLERLFLDDGWGRAKTLDYARRWAANKPSVESSRSTAAAKLQAGAYDLICGQTRSTVRELQYFAGAKNIGIVFPDPVPVNFGDVIFVPHKAPHPNAGILFMAWTGTREAQNLLDEINFSGNPFFPGNEINQVLKGKKVLYPRWADISRSDDDLAEVLRAMGMPVVRAKKKKKK